jgi:hypothetical protein
VSAFKNTLTDKFRGIYTEIFTGSIDRIKAGKQPFVSDTEQLRAMIAQTNGFAEEALAEEIANQLGVIGRDFGVV